MSCFSNCLDPSRPSAHTATSRTLSSLSFRASSKTAVASSNFSRPKARITSTRTAGSLSLGATDNLTYTISDNHGGTFTPTVHVTISSSGVPSPNIVVPASYQNGTFRVTFAGIPELTYTIQAKDSLEGSWTFLKTATAGADGLFEVIDAPTPPPPLRLYRTIYP